MMMQDLEGDVVTDQWLAQHGIAIPRASGIFSSPSAWVKTDRSGVIIAAGESDQTILAWLVENKTLNTHDIDYGIAYVTCRSAERAYRKQKGFKSSLDLAVLTGGGLSCEDAAEVFGLMRHEIGPDNCRIIEFACDTVRTADLPNYRPDFRRAFTALAKAFDRAVAQVRDEKKALAQNGGSC